MFLNKATPVMEQRARESVEVVLATLVEPRAYSMEGYYVFHGTRNPFSGTLHISKDNRLVGIIDNDQNATVSKVYGLYGYVSPQEDGSLKMFFAKVPSHPSLMRILYSFERKGGNSGDASGRFVGEWRHPHPGVRIEAGPETFRMIQAGKPIPDEFFDAETGGTAELNITLIQDKSKSKLRTEPEFGEGP